MAGAQQGGLPLEGIRVIDHGVVYTGTAATAMLADMGAEVIRVESISRFPSMTRGFVARPPQGLEQYFGYADNEPGERPWDRWYQLHAMNRNKLALALEINRPEGAEIYRRLVSVSDIIIENFSQGTMERLGLGYEVLKEVKPDIIMISASGLGAEGPYRGYSTFGSNLDAICGMMALRGYPGEDVTMVDPSPVWSDNVAAGTVAFAALVALHYRNVTGRGQYIDLAQAETFLPHMGEIVLDYTANGRLREPIGNDDMVMAPHGCYRCRGEDAWVTIAVSCDEEWQGFCRAIGQPAWTQRLEFATMLGRHHNRAELNRLVERWTLEHEPYEVMHLLQAEGVPAGPVIGPRAAFTDPHLEARGFFIEATHREVGTRRYPGMCFRFSRTPAGIRLPPPCLGEHNEYVLGEILGISPAEIARLAENKIIGTEYLPDV